MSRAFIGKLKESIHIPKDKYTFRDGKKYYSEDYNRAKHNGCYGKIKYRTLEAAERRILKDYPEDFTMLPYKCNYCRKYHIGHRKAEF